jgi:hypothetical protein
VWRSADIKADIKLGDLTNGLFTRDGVADDVGIPDADLGEFLD